MRLSKNINPGAFLLPRSYSSASTVELMLDGFIFHMPYRGVPCLTPTGWRIFRCLEKLLFATAEDSEFYQFQLPNIMANEDIAKGEPIAPSFRKKIIGLNHPWNDFHLLVTPEMLLHRFSSSKTISYKNLPIRYSYSSDFFRDMPDTKSFLTCRQFRVFGLLSLEMSADGISEANRLAEHIIDESARKLGIVVDNQMTDAGFETSYRANSAWAQAGPTLARDAMPIAMGYHYGVNQRLPLRYRTADNNNGAMQIYTFGLSLYRLMFALFDRYRDQKGFALPPDIRPFDVSLIPIRPSDFALSEDVRRRLAAVGLKIAVDDRYAVAGRERVMAAGYIGAPAALRVRDGLMWMVDRQDQEQETAVSGTDLVEVVHSLIKRHDG